MNAHFEKLFPGPLQSGCTDCNLIAKEIFYAFYDFNYKFVLFSDKYHNRLSCYCNDTKVLQVTLCYNTTRVSINNDITVSVYDDLRGGICLYKSAFNSISEKVVESIVEEIVTYFNNLQIG